MSLGFYRLIKGRVVVRHRHQPDGDSIHFVADNMNLFADLPGYSPAEQTGDLASYMLRFQAIDTPELHYGGSAQPHSLESRNALLTWLNVDPTQWDWVSAPRGFAWETEVQILCDGFEGHGRPLAYVLRDFDAEDGSAIILDESILAATYNYHAVQNGFAYLGLYAGGVTTPLRHQLIATYQQAKAANLGIWAIDQTGRFKVSTRDDLGIENGALVYPKIFRRCIDGLRWAGGEFIAGNDLDDFLQNVPAKNDAIRIQATHGGNVRVKLADVLEQMNNKIKIEIDLNTVEFG